MKKPSETENKVDKKKTEDPKIKRKEKGTKKQFETEAKSLGLIVYTPESRGHAQSITYDEILEGIKTGKFKYTHSTQRPDLEILEMLARRRIKFSDEDVKQFQTNILKKYAKEETVHLQNNIKRNHATNKYTKYFTAQCFVME